MCKNKYNVYVFLLKHVEARLDQQRTRKEVSIFFRVKWLM